MSSRMRSPYLKPPLPKSPIRLRSRQVLLSNSSSSTLQTPPGMTKPGRRLSHGDVEAKLSVESEDVKTRAEASNLENLAADSAPLVFERGRFYEEYSARRNERLKRKNGGEESVVKGTPYNLGVEPITTKRRVTAKKKTTVETTKPRYSLRSMSMSMTKENKKPPPPLPINVAVTSSKKKSVTTTMRGRRI
ncbi:hypothetical protein Bca4012_045749 [Brassica carinata]|uniref:Uncharacterized protein n=3 Tax=Brassica TaxID=3705 RepID=A0A0D3EE30_BRAOL|nr:PREDICTED: uncharacterized protein LOC106316756 [Brassica oleracea var. oleracea]KAG2273493.1 hypothetical protein Bca52824_056048 [Brassica carinata]CAF1778281.1 unnamed protein product [Brassica napus]CDY13989.1 BnaC09g38370D [Brassica napus]